MIPAPADSPNSVTRVRITAEGGDVVAHPSQRSKHVAQPEVGVETAARRAERGQVEESERSEPVGDGDDDDVAAAGQHPAVVERLARRAQDVGAAVNPHHHRLSVTGSGVRRRPDIQAQAVFALRCAEVDRDSRLDRLRADRHELMCVGDLGPRLRGFGCAPPPLTGRRGGVSHALPHLDPAVVATAHRPVDRVDHRIVACHRLDIIDEYRSARETRLPASGISDT